MAGLLRSTRTSYRKLWGSVYRKYLCLIGVSCGANLKLIGLPRVHCKRRGAVTIGCNVTLASDELSNPLGNNHRCIIYTVSRHAQIEIGDGVGMSGGTILSRAKISIGDNVLIGANCTIVDSDMHPLNADERRSMTEESILSAPVTIENDAWLGMNVLVLKGVTIGRNTIVGAGSVVSKSLPANVIAAGNPAKVLRQRGMASVDA